MFNTFRNKKIGIWGYGITGKSVMKYFNNLPCTLSVLDQNALEPEIITQLKNKNIHLYQPHEIAHFLDSNHYIVPSPGIDLRPHTAHAHKFLGEFDLFGTMWKKPIVAITGTVGKTTITHFISKLLEHAGKKIAPGGNIGTAMLDLIEEDVDYAVLELSSFQLELSTTAKPDVALITNIYPNHLDRHGSWEAYCAAKYKIINPTNLHQTIIVPLSLASAIRQQAPTHALRLLTDQACTQEIKNNLLPHDQLYYIENGHIYRYHNGKTVNIIPLPPLSYPHNWLAIAATLDALGIDPHIIPSALSTLEIPDHRLNCIAYYQGISFYNDSKATVPEAMLAAVTALQKAPIILFLGGISKGVDRLPSIQLLKQFPIKHVVCFGKEAQSLHDACNYHTISASTHATLEESFAVCMQQIARPGDQVLFSPAGASFDLFTDYQDRGNHFKKLVNDYIKD